MTSLSNKAENALNETRMLILGAQVLVGFDFQAMFQPAFDRLPAPGQQVTLIALSFMVVAVGLLIAPGAFHQIVECGNDTPRVIEYTGLIASLALLPFGVGIGLEVYIAVLVATGSGMLAITAGVIGSAFALFFWYGLDWLWRIRDEQLGQARKEERMHEPTSLDTRIKQVLTETRVALPGAQALLGFQLAAMLSDAFGRLPQSSQYVHLASLFLMAASIVFLMAPAAFHRIVERGEDSERLHRFSSAMLLAALVPLGCGMVGDFYVVSNRVLQSQSLAIGLAAAILVLFLGLWFGVTLALRARDRSPRGQLRVSPSVR